MTYPDLMPPTAPTMGRYLAAGFQSGRGPLSPGLEAQSARWTEAGLTVATQPHSVMNQLAKSPVAANLSAPSQRDRLLPNGYVMPNTMNGAAEPTAVTDSYLRRGVAQ